MVLTGPFKAGASLGARFAARIWLVSFWFRFGFCRRRAAAATKMSPELTKRKSGHKIPTLVPAFQGAGWRHLVSFTRRSSGSCFTGPGRNSSISGVLLAASFPQKSSGKSGGEGPHLFQWAFGSGRGRVDTQNQRFPVRPGS